MHEKHEIHKRLVLSQMNVKVEATLTLNFPDISKMSGKLCI